MDRKLGGLLRKLENNVLSFWAEIGYRLIPQELAQNLQYPYNSFAG
jgi:hypothetical protein